MISLHNVTRKYGDLTAVDNVSFDVPAGQIVGLLGHNGAGKTTIMKMITGFLEPTEGKITVDGHDVISDRIAAQKKIGYLPEVSPLYPDMTVVHYLEYVARLRHLPVDGIKNALKRVIHQTGLLTKLNARISTLSKGFKQRVGVAQAILHSPKILILDEPTSGLDPSQIGEMRALITHLSKESTVILSTHILQEVEAMCDHVIIILQGRVARNAALKDLQRTSRLFVGINQPGKAAKGFLEGISGVKNVMPYDQRGDVHRFRIEVEGELDAVSPVIASQVIGKGWKLHGLEPEHRDLEVVFKEVNEGLSV